MKYLAAAALLLIGTAGVAHADSAIVTGDPAVGETKSAACAGCHGPDGNSVNPIWPNLAGQGSPYLAKQLRDFKAGRREDPVMTGMAMAVQDDDIDDVAAYFATLEVKPTTPVKPELVDEGRVIFTAGKPEKGLTACNACHGPTGNGNAPAAFPALRAQHVAYTIKQLQMFRDGTRDNDMNAMMRNVAAKMSEQEIEAVAMYLSSLH